MLEKEKWNTYSNVSDKNNAGSLFSRSCLTENYDRNETKNSTSRAENKQLSVKQTNKQTEKQGKPE